MQNPVRAVRIERIRQLPARLEALVLPLTEAQLLARPLAGEWSVAQNVHHIADSHLNAYMRTRMVLTEEHPAIKPYLQERWAELADAGSPSIRMSLELLAGLHMRWVALFESLPDAAWARTGYHPESQRDFSIDDLLASYANHGEAHLIQIQQTLASQVQHTGVIHTGVIHTGVIHKRRDSTMYALGVDIGGSGVKGAVVNLERGELVGERLRYDTPASSHPEAVAAVVSRIVTDLSWAGPIGCTFPGIIHHGVVKTSANMDKGWSNTDGKHLLERVTGRSVRLLNDADAAGVAEMEFGAGRNQKGVTIMLTFGTGIGSAIFVDGHLLPNTEFGHLPIRGKDAEHRAAARVKKDEGLSWGAWAERVNEFLGQMEFFFSPDLFIVGGGISRKSEKFMPLLKTNARIVTAQLMNDAGIIGAAMYVQDIAIDLENPPLPVASGADDEDAEQASTPVGEEPSKEKEKASKEKEKSDKKKK